MTKEDITYYTRRITQGNKSDIIVVLYDIYFSYEKDARAALEKENPDDFAMSIRRTNEVVEHLKQALDFSYDIANQLYPLYDYVQRCLAEALRQQNVTEIDHAAAVMKELREAFIQVAKEDTSGREMQNVETVSAGYTYGMGGLNEFTDGGSNRGFLA